MDIEALKKLKYIGGNTAEKRKINKEKFKNVINKAKLNEFYYRVLSMRLLEEGKYHPWEVIATIHYLEASQRFDRHLHNGDPLTARTKRVPKGKPETGEPPFTWLDSAFDALMNFYYYPRKNWGYEETLEFLERYNGLGYRKKGILSPYLYSGTQLAPSKIYIKDHVIEENTKRLERIGAIVILNALKYTHQ